MIPVSDRDRDVGGATGMIGPVDRDSGRRIAGTGRHDRLAALRRRGWARTHPA